MSEGARAYRSEIIVRFTHCDAAGIVFYPRYFEMFNDLVEDWFRDGLGLTFSELHKQRGWGIPTVHLEVDFLAPSTFGEVLSATLSVRKLGSSSIRLQIVLCGRQGEERVRGDVVLVLIDRGTGRHIAIPEDLWSRISNFRAHE